MNECHFIGRLVLAPELSYHFDIPVVRFTLAVPREFKKSNGQPVSLMQFLNFEAWDTAALAIARCKQNELLIIDRASACSEADNKVVFRVDKFNYQSTLCGRKNDQKTSDIMDG